jgi:hypothetical protein
MSAKRKTMKAWRLSDVAIKTLENASKAHGVSMTELVETSVALYAMRYPKLVSDARRVIAASLAAGMFKEMTEKMAQAIAVGALEVKKPGSRKGGAMRNRLRKNTDQPQAGITQSASRKHLGSVRK